ncbi:MAG: DUF2254 domain-containing protein [Alsobacter sp.]
MRLWTIPTIYTAASLVAATIIPRLERAFAPDLVHGMSPAAAMAFLTATASGILSFTAIVFSIAFVMVQFSAMAYSPRLVLWFANRPMLYHALGTFIATFVYAMATLIWTDRGGNEAVPLVSMLIVLGLLVASMACFVILVQGLGRLQITDVLGMVGGQGRRVIAEEEHGRAKAAGATPRRLVPPPAGLHEPALVLRHVGEPRCVTSIAVLDLLRAAEATGAVLVLQAAVGDTLVEGSPVLAVHGAGPGPDPVRLLACVRLGAERTFEQDPKYPIRLLVDIAIKALSPAINDPTTAVQALDQIDDLLRRLSRLDLGSIWLADTRGQARLFVPLPDWEDYLSLAFDEIRQFGLTSVQVMRRMRAALLGLEEVLDREDRRPAVQRYLAHLDRAIAASEFDPTDRATARQVDPQGLGFSRDHRGEAEVEHPPRHAQDGKPQAPRQRSHPGRQPPPSKSNG